MFQAGQYCMYCPGKFWEMALDDNNDDDDAKSLTMSDCCQGEIKSQRMQLHRHLLRMLSQKKNVCWPSGHLFKL